MKKKCEQLVQSSELGKWTTDHEALYQCLDDTITKAMLSLERKAGKQHMGKYMVAITKTDSDSHLLLEIVIKNLERNTNFIP